jgi:hypothetical protein
LFVSLHLSGRHPQLQVVCPRWSISYPDVDFSAASVTLKQGSVSIPIVLEAVQDGVGENTLAWLVNTTDQGAMNAWPRPAQDTPIGVTVDGVLDFFGNQQTVQYTVTIFDPSG